MLEGVNEKQRGEIIRSAGFPYSETVLQFPGSAVSLTGSSGY